MAVAALQAAAAEPLAALVAEIEEAVGASRPEAVAEAVAARLRPWLGMPGLLAPEQRAAQAECYARNLLHTDPQGRFSLWAMVWAPGQGSTVHDHRCWCVMGVQEGVVTEESFRSPAGGSPDRVEPAGRLLCRAGATRALHPGIANIHRVLNGSAAPAVSIHVYGFDPAVACSSVGRNYEA